MCIAICLLLLCNSTPQGAGHGNSSKNSVHAAITERPGVQGLALKATSSRETRQLIVIISTLFATLRCITQRHSIRQSLGQDVQTSAGESSGSSGA